MKKKLENIGIVFSVMSLLVLFIAGGFVVNESIRYMLIGASIAFIITTVMVGYTID